ncbi:MAG: lipid asymmetry maintenance ABC transporter permease subunit MlaE [Candidatus Azosocius agrarius]|nr:MAG: lipid asymmetry maintenance ABC transporter permease subunit MlaE [Gammaproteobacteria bacterium]
MFNILQKIGEKTINFFNRLGKAVFLLFYSLFCIPNFRNSFKRVIIQLYFIGVLSLLIILVSGCFIGMVLGIQGYNVLVKFSAEQELGQMIAVSIIRELGPVITALLFAGRSGSSLTAEIGFMKMTEQLSSMSMMGVDPMKRIIGPRFWAVQISLPLLSLIFVKISIIGAFVISVYFLGVDGGSFWSNMQSVIIFQEDVINSIIKTFIFGFVIAWIAVFQGIYCVATAEGIGKATTNTVVYSSLYIFIIDFFLTVFMYAEV